MKKGRRNHSASFKAKVALEAIRGLKSTAELARGQMGSGLAFLVLGQRTFLLRLALVTKRIPTERYLTARVCGVGTSNSTGARRVAAFAG